MLVRKIFSFRMSFRKSCYRWLMIYSPVSDGWEISQCLVDLVALYHTGASPGHLQHSCFSTGTNGKKHRGYLSHPYWLCIVDREYNVGSIRYGSGKYTHIHTIHVWYDLYWCFRVLPANATSAPVKWSEEVGRVWTPPSMPSIIKTTLSTNKKQEHSCKIQQQNY